MLRPKIPTMPLPTGIATPPAIEPTAVVQPTQHAPAPATASPVASPRTRVQLTPSALVALVCGGTAVVLVVGAVLVSLLLAVAVTAASVAVCAVVLRSLLASEVKRR
ncbi:SpdD-like protein [Streptomyces lunaelactis]|uniref:SpdD-like protein n=1 Tax=Streptomyces lunaelactis TaxID=1535768 RepID=UPI001584A30D|nr:SpdD-like protein [Streptomyces lunaelactis]NUL05215.1 SpdD-like protein [Streptomyces lunaelactis]